MGGGRIALVAGGSGMVGSRLLRLLIDAGEYERVYALSRRPLPLEHARFANRVVRFEAPLEAQLRGFVCQDAFCCLGTTMRAAGSREGFRAVDHDLVIAFARAALGCQAQRLVVLSSVGASAEAKNFYLRVKGETERDLAALRPRSLDILQPSLLLGQRRERRPMELAAQALMWAAGPLFVGRWARFRAVDATLVAAAMRGAARSGRRGLYRYLYPELRWLAGIPRAIEATI